MRKFAILTFLFSFCFLPVLADESPAGIPEQNIENTKGFVGINYDRQDLKQVGKQKIVNDHSFFNINIQIIKEGALFKDLPDSNSK